MAACDNKDGVCVGVTGPDHPVDRDGNIITPPSGSGGCNPATIGNGLDYSCRPFQLDKLDKTNDYIENIIEEALNIGGATLNVYNMLGVHEQGRLVDCTGKGQPIAGGSLPNYPASHAFDTYVTEWRSIQRGQAAISASSYIGYDFGPIKTNDDSRVMYGIDTNIYKHITALAIKQSEDPNRRVTRARIERSQDGVKWYGVSVVLLPDDDCYNTILFKDSVPSRYWRIRPLDFTGGDNDIWSVQAIEMYHNYTATDIENVQDKVFLENRDRDYNTDPIAIKGSYDLIDVTTELTRYGIETPQLSLYIQVSFNACIKVFGRPLVIGDIIEIPSEAQYSGKMEKLEKWMEVTDVSWSTEGYTPGWRPTLLRVIAQPAIASQETQDIFGDLAATPDSTGLMDGEDGQHPIFQDYFDASQTIEAEANDAVPQKGAEGSGTIHAFEESEIEAYADVGVTKINNLGLNSTGLYVEDAMPPNNAAYTEAPVFPDSPSHGDYHRMTYEGLAGDIPARLYRYSDSKAQWVYLETDRRNEYNPDKPTLQEFLSSSTRVPNTEITGDRKSVDDECEEN